MSFTLEHIVPWGRSFDEYVAMFSLSENDLEKRIVGCGDGPANFNAELTERGGRVVSVDPIYRFSPDEIEGRIDATRDEILKQVRENAHEFVWEHIRTVEDLGMVRMRAMSKFLTDYRASAGNGRYVQAELPFLPFQEKEFDMALCSHLLFLYSEQLSLDFHLQAIEELCRIAYEVRIFPLLELGSRRSRHLDDVVYTLTKSGFEHSIELVPYEFQKGGNQMLRVRSSNVKQNIELP